MPGILK